MRYIRLFVFMAVFILPCFNGYADDTASVESEALEISDRLRCLVCSDPNIETADDETAKDLRFFIRRHLTDGKTQDLVVNLVLSNYGEMVSLELPEHQSSGYEVLFCLLLTGTLFLCMLFYIYRRSKAYGRRKREAV